MLRNRDNDQHQNGEFHHRDGLAKSVGFVSFPRSRRASFPFTILAVFGHHEIAPDVFHSLFQGNSAFFEQKQKQRLIRRKKRLKFVLYSFYFVQFFKETLVLYRKYPGFLYSVAVSESI